MIKIGIIGSDGHIQHLADLIKKNEDFELTGWYNDRCKDLEDAIFPDNFIEYPTLEALFRYVDSVVVNLKTVSDPTIITKCLKYFKHVFLTDAQYLKYDDFGYFEKIADESNVKFYPEFGRLTSESIDSFLFGLKDLLYIDINHTFSPNEGICSGGKLSLALLRDIDFLTNLIHANVKKVFANGWGFCEPGAGMMNARIDFDNASSANLLLINSIKPRQVHTVLYGKSMVTTIYAIDNIIKINQESLSSGMMINCFETIIPADNSLKQELILFASAIQQKNFGLRSIENKYKSIRIAHLIHEKINHFASINIFYS
ncbi:MAG TPA: hypothetical protein VIH57_24875 [Bacteroidales bacterium]